MDEDHSDLSAEDGELIERLARLLETARHTIADQLRKEHAPYKVTHERLVVRAAEEGEGWHSSRELVQSNSLRTMPSFRWGDGLEPLLGQYQELAQAVAERFRERLPLWTAIPPPGALHLLGLSGDGYIRNDPIQWVLAYILSSPTWHFLTELDSVEQPNLEAGRRIATEVVSLLTSGRILVRHAVAIDGIRTTEPVLVCQGNRLRTLEPLERGEFLTPYAYSTAPSLARGLLEPFAPTHMLEIDSDAGPPHEVGLLPVPGLLTALQLHQVDIGGSGVVSARVLPEWLPFGTHYRPFAMRTHTSPASIVSRELFEEACQTATLLSSYRLDAPERPSELSLHRFTLGCGRVDAADALLDYVIALEALLLPYDRETRFADLSYRFRMHGAHFISDTRHERRTLFRSLRHLYNMRSRIVHGDDYPDVAETITATTNARQLAARGLLKAVRTGFPDSAVLSRLVLGE
jgi:hypothetical protein